MEMLQFEKREPFLSVIVPVHNEAQRVTAGVVDLFDWVRTFPMDVEVIVVENGSQDETWALLGELARMYPLQALHLEEAGKGAAVRAGMLAASGRWRLMADVDWSMRPVDIGALVDEGTRERADVVIASREHVRAVRVGEPFWRNWQGRAFNWWVRQAALGGARLMDTQCGFKLFRGDVVEALFGPLECSGWAFDVEVLGRAIRLGYRIREVGVMWYWDNNSRVRPVVDALRMGVDVWRIGRRLDLPGEDTVLGWR